MRSQKHISLSHLFERIVFTQNIFGEKNVLEQTVQNIFLTTFYRNAFRTKRLSKNRPRPLEAKRKSRKKRSEQECCCCCSQHFLRGTPDCKIWKQ
jgi:hypothetical protein